MIKNYLKVAWRNLMKNKIFSFINVFGLSIGLTCCMLIALYINYESGYDRYHKNIKQLYQLGTIFVKQGKEERTPNTPAPMAYEMKQEFPEIRQTARIMALFAEDKTLLQYKEDNGPLRSFYEDKGFMADSTFFRMFNYDFIEGNAATSLDNANTVVLSEEIAQRLFGHEPALNKIIRISSNTNGDTNFVVTGVFRPVKKPSQIDARFFLSVRGGGIEQFMNRQTDMVSNNMFHTFFLLQPGASAKNLESKFPAFVDKYIGDGLRKSGFYKKQFLIPVRDMHLRAGMPSDISAVGSVTYLYILACIAVFTLLIACINFMNLSTARSSKRSAEVGVRKVLGAEKKSLVRQFLGESVLLSMIAFVLALVFTRLLLPGFAAISGKEISFSFEQHRLFLAGFFVLAVLTGLLAGSYPAFYLSSFQPVKVLKGRISNSLAAVSLRKVLVVFQFVISVILIVASVIINNQMKYMRTKDLGFAKDQQIVIPLRSANAKNIYTSLKSDIRNNSQVKGTGAAFYYPGILNPSDFGLYMEGKTVNDAQLVHTNIVDESLLQTLDIKPIAGRLFSEQFPADTNRRLVMNEAAIRKIGFGSPEKAVGHNVHFDWRGETYTFTIVGVVKDFHFQDLHVPIEPYCFQLNNQPYYNYLIVHAKAADVSPLLKSIETSWHKFDPSEPFEYSFLDEDFQKNYRAENRLSSIVGYFTVIAILISCLGLFGLATFSAEQRTKEIGIRKVLGASVGNIVGLLSKEFLKLVLIAVVIASPVAWWAMNKWLQDFAYKANIGWVVFAATAGIALLIALLTISFQAIKAAIANPVKSLRTE
ncbi:MAG: FtsX-like permease family protein [Bacteroidetes bacterium]|jgi:putative ABC transport system permease protein|nr:MAG: FtsX-like permease family protein [Bacteroidota bacterium]